MTKGRFYKALIRKLIQEMPTKLKLVRKIRIDKGYGNYDTETEEIEIECRFYFTGEHQRSGLNPIHVDGGMLYSDKILKKMLLDFDTDVRKDDTFVFEGEKMIVRNVTELLDYAKIGYVELL